MCSGHCTLITPRGKGGYLILGIDDVEILEGFGGMAVRIECFPDIPI